MKNDPLSAGTKDSVGPGEHVPAACQPHCTSPLTTLPIPWLVDAPRLLSGLPHGGDLNESTNCLPSPGVRRGASFPSLDFGAKPPIS